MAIANQPPVPAPDGQPHEKSDEQWVNDFMRNKDVGRGPRPHEKSDEAWATDLIRRIEGEVAFEYLYAKYRPLVFRYLMGICPAEAEDLTQECLFRFARRPHLYDPGKGPLKPWLFKIARNLACSYWDRLKRTVLRTGREYEAPIDIPADNPPDAVMTMTIDRCLEELSPAERAVLLTWLETDSLVEAAGILGKPEGTVRSDKSRAIAKLKKLFNGA